MLQGTLPSQIFSKEVICKPREVKTPLVEYNYIDYMLQSTIHWNNLLYKPFFEVIASIPKLAFITVYHADCGWKGKVACYFNSVAVHAHCNGPHSQRWSEPVTPR